LDVETQAGLNEKMLGKLSRICIPSIFPSA